MKKSAVVIVYILLAVFCICSCAPGGSVDIAEAAEALTGADMMGRQAGTRGGAAAGKYIAGVFDDIGLEVETSSFSAEAFLPETLATSLVIDGLECVYMQDYAPAQVCGSAEVTGSITFDVNDEDITQKIWATSDLTALKAGSALPKGILIREGDMIRYVHTVESSVPIFCVSDAVYSKLAKGTGQVVMSISAGIEEIQLNNITGTIKGKNSDYAIVISAHYDGCGFDERGIYESAVDNASGVVTMLKTAEMMANEDYVPETDIVFAAFDGEEYGLLGSSRYIYEMDYKDVININIDCIEKGRALTVQANEADMGFAALLSSYIDGSIACGITGLSDNLSFSLSGYPSVMITTVTDSKGGVIHTAEDTIDKLDMNVLLNVANDITEYVENIQ